MGLLKQKSILNSFKAVKGPPPVELSVKMAYQLKMGATRRIEKRRSKRLTGAVPDYLELDVDGQAVSMEGANPEESQPLYQDRLVDLMERDTHHVELDGVGGSQPEVDLRRPRPPSSLQVWCRSLLTGAAPTSLYSSHFPILLDARFCAQSQLLKRAQAKEGEPAEAAEEAGATA
ncbi:MAG: hypothetical protein WDW38_007115 [Sanguina aurantia]